LDSDEQKILKTWYNSLTDKAGLTWNVIINLCGQYGVYCDNSQPNQRVETL